MGDSGFFRSDRNNNQSEQDSKYGEHLPRWAADVFAQGRTGVNGDGTQIKPNVPNADVLEPPATSDEALEWRRGEVNDHLADRDRLVFRFGQWLWNSVIAFRNSGAIEPPTLVEQTQLQTIQNAINHSPGPGLAALNRDRDIILRGMEDRGRWRGPLGVLGVTLADMAVDQVLFPKDHIKYGTVIADFGGAMGMMFMPFGWRYKALGMVGMHVAGRVYDHFIQGNEATNAYKPRPRWERSSEVNRAISGAGPVKKDTPTGPTGPVYQPPNADFIASQKTQDQILRDQNAMQQKKNEEAALIRFQAKQDALQQWRQAHPSASQKDESEFLTDWYKRNP